MRIRSTVTALSTAFALAVMLSTASTPAFAAKSTNGDTKPPTIVDATDKKPPKIEQVKPGSIVDSINPVQPKLKPDLRVSYLDFNWNGTGKDYTFRIENIGIETANNITVNSQVKMSSHGGGENVGVLQTGDGAPTFGPLATGEHKDITIPCRPNPGYTCDGASVSASVQDDINPNNNAAGGS